jgi:hypothetical protein
MYTHINNTSFRLSLRIVSSYIKNIVVVKFQDLKNYQLDIVISSDVIASQTKIVLLKLNIKNLMLHYCVICTDTKLVCIHASVWRIPWNLKICQHIWVFNFNFKLKHLNVWLVSTNSLINLRSFKFSIII